MIATSVALTTVSSYTIGLPPGGAENFARDLRAVSVSPVIQ